KFVKRPVNPQPTPWEVVRTIPKGTTHYAVFDALKGYHQIELDEESRALTSFMTPFGRYRYVRLPMGYAPAGDVFTLRYGNAVDIAVDGRRATEDTLLRGQTFKELIENTEEFIRTCAENKITLNVKKIQWNQPEVLFGGFMLDKDGYHIDPVLTTALREFPHPKNQTDVRSFCGLANQTCNFSDEISGLLMPLKELLKKNVKFQWLPEHETAFLKAREHLSSTKVLAFYDPDRKTRLICDASRLNGLGFVLKQEIEPDVWKTVQAGSRFLTSAETRYAMIELEMLGIAWAAKKCSMFIEGMSGRLLEIWTDHQPLVPILNKYSLPEIENKRLQRLRMKVDHLQFTVKWVKGK
ncbi:MAG: reverse transcriptase family protein, partial [Polynucleobacter sp.]